MSGSKPSTFMPSLIAASATSSRFAQADAERLARQLVAGEGLLGAHRQVGRELWYRVATKRSAGAIWRRQQHSGQDRP
jgi:hypothetical protein